MKMTQCVSYAKPLSKRCTSSHYRNKLGYSLDGTINRHRCSLLSKIWICWSSCRYIWFRMISVEWITSFKLPSRSREIACHIERWVPTQSHSREWIIWYMSRGIHFIVMLFVAFDYNTLVTYIVNPLIALKGTFKGLRLALQANFGLQTSALTSMTSGLYIWP